VMRLALLLVVLFPALALAQGKEKDEDKVSNDQPDRPLQMPPATTEVKEAIDDFDRFSRRAAWERALKSLYTISEDQAQRFVDGEKGFIIPVGRKRRLLLAALPAAGRAAYRLFYDSEAKKLFDEASGANELKVLERLYSAYFSTSIGDNAADRLGDLYYELGRYDRAADCWLDVLRERTDTDLSPALLSVKAALALKASHRQSELEQVRADVGQRYASDKVTIAGQTATAPVLLDRLLKDEGPAPGALPIASASSDPGLSLPDAVEPVWQMRFGETVEAGMTPAELTQWEQNALSGAVPAVCVSGTKLFANYLSYLFAIDLKSGKLLWRSAAFHNVEVPAMQNVAQFTDTTRYTIIASGEHVWTLSRDLKDGNFQAPFVLTCLRAENGEIIWQSKDLSDYAQLDLNGPPILEAGKIFIPASGAGNPQQGQGGMQQLVLALQPHDGKVIWKSAIGALRQDNRYRWWGYSPQNEAQPRLVYRAGAIYAETHQGVFARLDADSGTPDWGFAYQTDAVQGGGRMFFWGGNMPTQEPTSTSSIPLSSGEAFLLKGLQSTRLNALDPNRMKVLWERPISKGSRLLAADDRTVYLGGAELSAIDIESRKLLWATRVPGGCANARVLVRKDAIWQSTPRGIIELDPKSGEVRRFFRGKDLGSVGGDLILADQLLLAVSNRTITAYPRMGGAIAVAPRSASATTNKRVTNE
jgi:outer membrane protein assembly factor BamB/tetratricopeptide (TPR) repeat protein